MPIDTRCPSCRAGYRLSDETEGKKVRCKKCWAAFEVLVVAEPEEAETNAEAESTPPAGRRKRRTAANGDADRPRRKKRSEKRRPLVIAGFAAIIVVVLLVCVGLGFLIYFMSAKEIEQ